MQTTEPTPAVAVRNLTKRFGDRTAVRDLTFDLPRGVVAGFIGPNGAGKTTTMAMLLGLVAPTSGGGEVLGQPLGDPSAYLHRVGALIESPALWPSLTGEENLRLLATLGGHDPGGIPALLELVGLTDRAGDPFKGYSFGMKQRLGIAAALLGDPALVVLDEPTNGLDPAGINDMRQLIRSLGRHDRTVLVSSHILSELEHVCDWLIVIDEGALLYQGPASGFLDGAGTVVRATSGRPGDDEQLARLASAEGYEVLPGPAGLSVPADSQDPRDLATALNRMAFEHGIVLAELTVHRPTLESHYLATIGGDR